MRCSMCGEVETALDIRTGKRRRVKTGDNARSIICGDCTQARLKRKREKADKRPSTDGRGYGYG